ncbi:hypothetical protein M758_2G125100 [Ceratodon purpureus]|nr:hypothetical protein M758_2G125100 [Ceratodon purpureus]
MARLMQQSDGKQSVQQGKGFARVLVLSSIAGGLALIWYDRHLKKRNEASVPEDPLKEGRQGVAPITISSLQTFLGWLQFRTPLTGTGGLGCVLDSQISITFLGNH